MDKSQLNGYSSVYNGTDDDFEFMGDLPREDSAAIEVENLEMKIWFFSNSIFYSVVDNVIMK